MTGRRGTDPWRWRSRHGRRAARPLPIPVLQPRAPRPVAIRQWGAYAADDGRPMRWAGGVDGNCRPCRSTAGVRARGSAAGPPPAQRGPGGRTHLDHGHRASPWRRAARAGMRAPSAAGRRVRRRWRSPPVFRIMRATISAWRHRPYLPPGTANAIPASRNDALASRYHPPDLAHTVVRETLVPSVSYIIVPGCTGRTRRRALADTAAPIGAALNGRFRLGCKGCAVCFPATDPPPTDRTAGRQAAA